MTKQKTIFFLAILSVHGAAFAAAHPCDTCVCNCNCRAETGSRLDGDYDDTLSQSNGWNTKEYDFRNPEHSLTFGFGVLEGKDPGKLIIRRTEPLSLRYEHRFARWLYLSVAFKTELTDLTYYNHFGASDAGTENLQMLDLQVGLKSRWNKLGGAGMRFVPYQSRRLALDLSLGFEEMALSDVKIENVYFINPLLSFEIGNMVQDHARIRYNWRKLDFETRLDWTPHWLRERFTPHMNLGAMLAKSDLEIWYDEEIAERITDASAATGITPVIPSHETFYVFAPSIGAGLEFRITDHIAVDISGSMLPFSDRTVRIGTLGLILRQ